MEALSVRGVQARAVAATVVFVRRIPRRVVVGRCKARPRVVTATIAAFVRRVVRRAGVGMLTDQRVVRRVGVLRARHVIPRRAAVVLVRRAVRAVQGPAHGRRVVRLRRVV